METGLREPSRIGTTSRPALLALAAVAVLLLLVVGLGAGTSQAACVSCHRPAARSLANDPHSSVRCVGCHLQAGGWSYPALVTDQVTRMYPSALAGKGLSGPATPTSAAACRSCHEEIMRSKVPVESKGVRILHRSCAADSATCDTCHAGEGHGAAIRNPRGPVMEDCISCHDRERATKRCLDCHPDKVDLDEDAPGPFAITHGPNWRKTHGLGRLSTCRTCHRKDSCVTCHGVSLPHPADFGRTHGTFAKGPGAKCAVCHKQSTFCSSCHSIEMPHPDDFLKRHSSLVTDVADKRCARCHEKTSCQSCHERHIHPGGARGIPVPPRIPGGGGR